MELGVAVLSYVVLRDWGLARGSHGLVNQTSFHAFYWSSQVKRNNNANWTLTIFEKLFAFWIWKKTSIEVSGSSFPISSTLKGSVLYFFTRHVQTLIHIPFTACIVNEQFQRSSFSGESPGLRFGVHFTTCGRFHCTLTILRFLLSQRTLVNWKIKSPF